MIIFRKIIFPSFLIIATLFAANSFAQTQFVENKGQWDDRVKYRGDFSSGAFFLQEKGFRVLMQNTDDLQKLSEYLHG
ncbi:MAG TPA: hypothetical protein VKH37_03050, partial [Ferruginibacter sp.]|nr:hypothetical protein [Ferruginibacter sp.]